MWSVRMRAMETTSFSGKKWDICRHRLLGKRGGAGGGSEGKEEKQRVPRNNFLVLASGGIHIFKHKSTSHN